jgi:Bacterial TniB protein
MVVNLDHLHPAYRHHASLPDEERIAWIRSDRWVNFAMAERALQRLEALLAYPRGTACRAC